MGKYFVYFFAILLAASEMTGLGFMGIITALCIRMWQNNPNPQFPQPLILTKNLHMFLTPLGAVFLTGNGALLFRILRNYRTSSIKHLHTFILGVSLIITGWGYWCGMKLVFYRDPNKPPDKDDRSCLGYKCHFFSLHSTLGLFSLLLLLVEFIGGIVLYMGGMVSKAIAEDFNGLHGFVGISSLFFNAVTAITGMGMIGNEPRNFDRVYRDERVTEASYENFTLEYQLLFAGSVFIIIYAWNLFYMTVNPYFEWTMIERY